MYKAIVQYSLFCVSVSATPLLTCLLHVICKSGPVLEDAPASNLEVSRKLLPTFKQCDVCSICVWRHTLMPICQNFHRNMHQVAKASNDPDLRTRGPVLSLSDIQDAKIQHQRPKILLWRCTLSRQEIIRVQSLSTERLVLLAACILSSSTLSPRKHRFRCFD
jgi:hypothetical protein